MRVKAVVVAASGMAALLGAWPASASDAGPHRQGDHEPAEHWSEQARDRHDRSGADEAPESEPPPERPAEHRERPAIGSKEESSPLSRTLPREGGGKKEQHPAEPEARPSAGSEAQPSAEPEAQHPAEPEAQPPAESHEEHPGEPPRPRNRASSRPPNPAVPAQPPRLVSLWTQAPAGPPQQPAPNLEAPAPPAVRSLPSGPRPLVELPPVTRLIETPLGPVPPVLAFALVALGLLLMARRRRLAARRERELEEAKGTFIRVASHELRTPLTVVRGYLAMAAEGSLSQLSTEMKEVLRTVSGNVDDLYRLSELMLEAAQIDTRQLHLDKTVVDLRVVLRDCVEAMGEDAKVGSRLVFEAASRRIPVRADPDRLCTMVVNLVENAFRHSPEGGDIRCSVFTSGRRARVAVSDQGPGIPPQELPRLFARFGASSLAGGRVAGSGLGLYLVRELARLHGGDIEVRTMAGGGSTFTVVLPLAESRWTRLRRGSDAAEATESAQPVIPPRSPP